MRARRVVLSTLLVSVILTTSIPGGFLGTRTGSAASAQTSDPLPDEGTGPFPEAFIEVASRRTERSKLFLRPDGSFDAYLYTRPVHFQTADGSW